MVRMLLELGHPCIRYDDTLLLWIVIGNTEPCFVRICDDILHVLIFQSTHDAEEKFSLRKLAR